MRLTLSPRLALWLFVPALLLISYLALSPTPPRAADLGWDKLNHLSAFGLLMLIAAQAWPGRRWPAALGLLAYGGLIELLQTQVPGRAAEWGDLLADGLGLLLGLLLGQAQRHLQDWLARVSADRSP